MRYGRLFRATVLLATVAGSLALAMVPPAVTASDGDASTSCQPLLAPFAASSAESSADRSDDSTLLVRCVEARQERLLWIGGLGFGALALLVLVGPVRRTTPSTPVRAAGPSQHSALAPSPQHSTVHEAADPHHSAGSPDPESGAAIEDSAIETPLAAAGGPSWFSLPPSPPIAPTDPAAPDELDIPLLPRAAAGSDFEDPLGFAQAEILALQGVRTWEDLANRSRRFVSRRPGMDQNTMQFLDAGLAARGLEWLE